MIDAHCHIDLYPDPVETARQCGKAGLRGIAVTTVPSAWRISSSIVKRHSKLIPALGLHPQVAHERFGEMAIFDKMLVETDFVGEIGLDGAPEFRSSWDRQSEVFMHILRKCANAGGKVMSIHSRRSATAVLDSLEAFPAAGIPVLHWFSGSQSELVRAIDLGAWFSVGPAMLASKNGRRLFQRMPMERVLTETDGPFASANGLPLHPWEANRAISLMADLVQLSPAAIQSRVTANFDALLRSLSETRT